jgi:hypothetical protein
MYLVPNTAVATSKLGRIRSKYLVNTDVSHNFIPCLTSRRTPTRALKARSWVDSLEAVLEVLSALKRTGFGLYQLAS